MAKFLRLHLWGKKEPIYVNIDKIENFCIDAKHQFTEVLIGGYTFSMKETPEQILEMLKEA